MAIAYDVQDGVAHVRFNRPEKLNALTLRMYEELGQAFREANDNDSVRSVLLSGAGERAFCVGADLTESIPALAQGHFDISQWDDAHIKFEGFNKPIVSAINGLCMGGGFEIMLATDIRIASTNAEFALPEASLGFTPAGGTLVRLVRQIPYAFAMELMMTSDRFSAARLAQMGVLNHVVAPEKLMELAMGYALRIAKNGRVALAVIKEAAQTLSHLPLPDAFAREAQLGQMAFTSAEARAGLEQFRSR